MYVLIHVYVCVYMCVCLHVRMYVCRYVRGIEAYIKLRKKLGTSAFLPVCRLCMYV